MGKLVDPDVTGLATYVSEVQLSVATGVPTSIPVA